jgi:hypothetical protein
LYVSFKNGTSVSYEEEQDTCVSYEEVDTCVSLRNGTSAVGDWALNQHQHTFTHTESSRDQVDTNMREGGGDKETGIVVCMYPPPHMTRMYTTHSHSHTRTHTHNQTHTHTHTHTHTSQSRSDKRTIGVAPAPSQRSHNTCIYTYTCMCKCI